MSNRRQSGSEEEAERDLNLVPYFCLPVLPSARRQVFVDFRDPGGHHHTVTSELFVTEGEGDYHGKLCCCSWCNAAATDGVVTDACFCVCVCSAVFVTSFTESSTTGTLLCGN